MKQIVKISILVILLFSACKNREWNNPFDLDCPKQLFTPSNFTAKQEGNEIALSWIQSNNKISGFRIERKVGKENFSGISMHNVNDNSAKNKIKTGGELHSYKIYALAGDNKSNEVITSITPVTLPNIATIHVTSVTGTSAIAGGNITSDGGEPVTARGVVFDILDNPTTETYKGKTVDGKGIGIFSSTLSGLQKNTKYYVRAYATNKIGTNYGTTITFTTQKS